MKKKEQKKNQEEKEKRKREIHRSLSFLFEKHAEISAANPVDWFHRVEMQKKKPKTIFLLGVAQNSAGYVDDVSFLPHREPTLVALLFLLDPLISDTKFRLWRHRRDFFSKMK